MRRLVPWLAVGCAPSGDGARVPDPVAVVTTASSTYDSGALAVVGEDGATADVGTLAGDAVVVADAGAVFVVQRLGTDTVRRYAPDAPTTPSWEVSTGRGSNPQDVAACGGALFVSRLEETSLRVLDPVDGRELGTVSLGAWADDDGIPEAADLVVDGDRLLVGLQRLHRLDDWTPDPVGVVAVVDCATRTVVDTVDVGPNPTLADGPDGVVVVAEDGVRVGLDGPPALVDVDGARVVDVAIGPDGRGAFVARDGDEHALGCLDADLVPTVLDRVANYVPDVAVDAGGRAWFAVRQGWSDPGDPGGLRRVALDGCVDVDVARTTLAPFSIALP